MEEVVWERLCGRDCVGEISRRDKWEKLCGRDYVGETVWER